MNPINILVRSTSAEAGKSRRRRQFLPRRGPAGESRTMAIASRESVPMSKKSQRSRVSEDSAGQSFDLASAFNQALALHKAGRLIEAQTLYGQILSAQPDHFDSLHLFGVSCLQRGDCAEALRQIDLALKVNSSSAFAHNNRGSALKELKRFDEAVASHDRAIALRPGYPECFYNRANALMELERRDDALASYEQAIALKPDYAEAHLNRGVALEELGRLAEALASADKAVALRPDFAEAYFNRGNVQKALHRLDEALASYDKALALRPNYPEAFHNRGVLLMELNRLDEALAAYDNALACKPDYPEALNSRGIGLTKLNRLEAALAAHRQALALRPDYAEAHWNEALLRLLTGDFERGWAKFEWRWKNGSLALRRRDFPQPLWLGAESIEGKTILLHAEQGLGDAIQFSRYASLVAGRGATVVLEVEKSLCELMSGLAGVTQCISKGDTIPRFDLHCPLLSLPLAFRTRLETIPSPTPYLQAPARAVADWGARLGPKSRPRIGLVWSGDPRHKNDRCRSAGLRTLLPLLDVAATFVSLQREVRADDAPLLRERDDIVHFGEAVRTFSDTAALVWHLDLVITVDTSVAHLAGALGRPVWILLPFIPDWRWLLDRNNSPWYPTARLFRQSAAGEWRGVVDEVRRELSDLLESQRPGA